MSGYLSALEIPSPVFAVREEPAPTRQYVVETNNMTPNMTVLGVAKGSELS
jgi:hypothetical protein